MVSEELLACDLCILAYQLYHQSVLWPLDPWYEVLARGATDRRSHFMDRVHAYARTLPARSAQAMYAGPAVLGRLDDSNEALDPILTNFVQPRPRDPAWNGDGAVFIGMRAPSYVVDPIRYVSACTYDGPWRPAWPHGNTTVTHLHDYGDGTDELILFEGGTGSFKNSTAAFSPMGYVLKRTRRDHSWDAYIAFRGSRSGDAARALTQGMDGAFNGPSGNADWVTDMASQLQQDDYVGGEVGVGFAAALKRCMGTIARALFTLHAKYGAPQSIQITGHSLGAALANLCTGALLSGTPGVELRKHLRGWPFDQVSGCYMALPPVGSQAYCAEFVGKLGARAAAPYVAGDPVVECSKSVALSQTGGAGWVGARLGSGGYTAGALDRLARPQGCHSDENSHEIYLIRMALAAKSSAVRELVPQAIRDARPWAIFVTFADMLDGRPVSSGPGDRANIVTRDNLRATLQNFRFAQHFEAFLHMLQGAVADPKAYRGFHRDETYKLASERVALALEMCAHVEGEDKAQIVDTVATQIAALIGYSAKTELVRKGITLVRKPVAEGDGVALAADELLGPNFNTRIGLGLILRAFQEKTGTRFADFEGTPELDLCLQVALPAVSGAQEKRRA